LRRTPSAAARAELASSAALFAALGDGTRLKLVGRLCDEGPISISGLSNGLPITRQAVTKHLRVMEQAGLVRSTTRGRERVWQIEQRRLADARRHLERISAQWDAALGRLKDFVEKGTLTFSHETKKR
jgi:DNA-binding transcriptional ArsR family regulator